MVDFIDSLSNRLSQGIGIKQSLVTPEVVEAVVDRRIEILKIPDRKMYYHHLLNNNLEWQELIELFINKETWFLREEVAFDFLVECVMKKRVNDNYPVSILVAPCSTGEEVYSILMKIFDAGFSEKDVLIDAYDISKQAIDVARLGVYSSHSFRGKNLKYVDKYFFTQSGSYNIEEYLKEPVLFSQANLVDEHFKTRQPYYDVIFCRNLFIYLNDQARKKILNHFKELMHPASVLIVSPPEIEAIRKSGFLTRTYHDKMIYLQKEANHQEQCLGKDQVGVAYE